jgi:hypothetical protein
MKNYFILILVVLLGSCSDKYKSVYESAPAPEIRFNKDVLTIREKDYTNINLTNNGMLTIYCSSASHQLNIQIADKSDLVHFMYRGDEIQNGQPFVAMDSVKLFCTSDSVGVYSVDFYLTDQLGKTTKKQLIVNCLANQGGKASFFWVPLGVEQLQAWPYVFDGSLSTEPDGVITSYHYSINGQQIMTTQPVMNWVFHAKGTHDIGLYVTDDLGKNSDTLHKQITIQ